MHPAQWPVPCLTHMVHPLHVTYDPLDLSEQVTVWHIALWPKLHFSFISALTNQCKSIKHLQGTPQIGLILSGPLTKQSHQDLNLLHFWAQIPSSLCKNNHCSLRRERVALALSPSLPYEVVAVLNHMYMSDVTRDKVNQSPEYKLNPATLMSFSTDHKLHQPTITYDLHFNSGMIFVSFQDNVKEVVSQTFANDGRQQFEKQGCKQHTNYHIWQWNPSHKDHLQGTNASLLHCASKWEKLQWTILRILPQDGRQQSGRMQTALYKAVYLYKPYKECRQ